MLAAVVDTVRGLDDEALTGRFRELELERRRIEAELAAVVAEADRRRVYRIDGHHSITGWLLANANWSSGQAARVRRSARLVTTVPDAGEALLAGRIGTAQADELARVRANPRCGHRLADSVDVLLEHVEQLSFADSRLCIRRWEVLADLDGAHRDRESNLEHRSATVTEIDGAVFAQATGGSAVDAQELVSIFDRFVEREFRHDVAERTRLHGPDAHAGLLARTGGQRRFDALHAIFRAAVANPDSGVPADTVVNVIVDQYTFEHHAARHRLGVEPVDLRRVDLSDRRCETLDGTPLLPDDVLCAALSGHVRRVVMNSAGVITDVGRKRRLYRGVARTAVQIMARHCVHPGCTVKAALAQVDHLDEWSRDRGRTDLVNGGASCAGHNRFKHRKRIRTRRTRDGRVVDYRADGRPMLPVGCSPPDDTDFLTDAELDDYVRRRLLAEVERARARSAG